MLGNIHSHSAVRVAPITTGLAPVQLRISLLGNMQVIGPDGEPRLPAGRKTRALLAMVALAMPRLLMRSRIAETLWSRSTEELARASLRQEIHRLVDALGDTAANTLIVSREHIGLRPETVWLDVAEALQSSSEAPASLSLLGDRLLDGLDGLDPAFDAWLATERAWLRGAARKLAETALKEASEPDKIIAITRQLLSIDPVHEAAWQALIKAHAAKGERHIALEAYEQCRTALAERLAAVPSEETERLIAAIRQASPVVHVNNKPATPPVVAALSVPPPARLGILPLKLLGESGSAPHLVAVLTAELIAALTRCDQFSLVAMDAPLAASIDARFPASGAQTATLDFALDGTVQKTEKDLRVMLRLMDLRAGGKLVWARRFDRPITDLFAVQEEIALQTAAEVEPEVLKAQIQQMRADPASAKEGVELANALVLRAVPLLMRPQREQAALCEEMLTQACDQAPDWAKPHIWLAFWDFIMAAQGWAEDRAARCRHAAKLVERALLLAPNDALVLTLAGHIRAELEQQTEEAIALHERALARNPASAIAWSLSGVAYAYLGDLAEAERRLQRYKALAPLHPNACVLDAGFPLLALLRRDYRVAAALGRSVSSINPTLAFVCVPYLAALGHLSAEQEAEAARRRLLAIDPFFTIARFLQTTPLRREADKEHVAEGLRRAGVAER